MYEAVGKYSSAIFATPLVVEKEGTWTQLCNLMTDLIM